MGLPNLDRCLARRMGRDEGSPISREELRAWQVDRLRVLIAHAKANSPFYRDRLAGIDPEAVRSLDDFSRLPRITPDDLREGPERMLCVSRDEIARVVTLTSSGTTGAPKRVFHTRADLEATTDFFALGMANMARPGDAVLVLMPDDRPGGVARLLCEALARSGARGVAHGVLADVDAAVDHCLEASARCVVGPPAHLNLMALAWERRGLPRGVLRSVLLCWDAVPDAVARNCERAFGCGVFRHWGMIETGLGGGVDCAPGSGLHLREADVFVEITDPATGALLPDGEEGELVVSTPLRLGMPFIRYRTGDLGRILPGPCGCGSPLRRLDPHVRRMGGAVCGLDLVELNEILYAVDGLGDFALCAEPGRIEARVCGAGPGLEEKVRSTLETAPGVRQALGPGNGVLDVVLHGALVPAEPGLAKRTIRTGRRCHNESADTFPVRNPR